MNDCILHCFKNIQNHTFELDQKDIIDEVDFFSFCIESDVELFNVTILITDIPIKIVKVAYFNFKFWYELDNESVKEYFKSQGFNNVDFYFKVFDIGLINEPIWFYKLFINYPIGLCDIVLFDNTNEKTIKSFYLNIVSSKMDETEFISIVAYVEDKGASIWAKYSLLKHTAKRLDAEDKMEWLTTLIEDFVEKLTNDYLDLFSFDKIKIIETRNEIVDYSIDVNTSEDSLFWLINNLDVLQSTVSNDVSKLVINNRLFVPSEILSFELKESTDTNENHMIHGFMSELKRFFIEIEHLFEGEIKKCSKIKFNDLVNFYSYTRSLSRLRNLVKKLTKIKYYLEEHIPVSIENLDYLNTNKIGSKEHYSYVFEKMMEFMLYKDATFSKEKKLFKGINRMDHLFERACFYKLIDSFEKLGYESEYVNFDKFNFPTKVKLTKKGAIHYLYSQIIPENLITVRAKNENGVKSGDLSPDFVIELENEKYIIIDAKYKKINNINRYVYPELILKYLHGIGYESGGFFNPLGLFVIYPDKNRKIEFYQKDEFNLYSENPVFPSIGSISLNFEEESKLSNSTIQKLLEIN
jgi:hypothetical protein